MCAGSLGGVRQGPGGPDAVPVAMEDDDFVPDVLELDAGFEVRVEVTNHGASGHNFTIDDLDVSTGTVEPGGVMTATVTVPAGTTGFHCTFHPGMDGQITAT